MSTISVSVVNGNQLLVDGELTSIKGAIMLIQLYRANKMEEDLATKLEKVAETNNALTQARSMLATLQTARGMLDSVTNPTYTFTDELIDFFQANDIKQGISPTDVPVFPVTYNLSGSLGIITSSTNQLVTATVDSFKFAIKTPTNTPGGGGLYFSSWYINSISQNNGIITLDPGLESVDYFSIATASGNEVGSLKIAFRGGFGAGVTYTAHGYKDGVAVTGATKTFSMTTVSGNNTVVDFSSQPEFLGIDEIRLTTTDVLSVFSTLSIDNIIIGPGYRTDAEGYDYTQTSSELDTSIENLKSYMDDLNTRSETDIIELSSLTKKRDEALSLPTNTAKTIYEMFLGQIRSF